MVVQPLCIPLVICPVHRTYVIVVWWNDGLLCGKYKWVSQFQTPCCSHSVDRWALSGAGAFIFHPWHCTFIINSPDNSMCVAHWQVSNGMGSEQTLLQDSSLPSLTPAHTLLEWLFQKQHGSSLTASAPVWDVSAPACTNGVWPSLRPVSVVQKNKPSTMLSSNVQDIYTSLWTALPGVSKQWHNQMVS